MYLWDNLTYLLTNSPTVFKVICVLLTLFFVLFLIFFIFSTRWLKFLIIYDFVEFFTVKFYGYYAAHFGWKRALKKFNKQQYNQAVLIANQTLDKVLKKIVPLYSTNDFEERLRITGLGTFSNPKKIWEAYVYCIDNLKTGKHNLTQQECQGMLEIYQQAFKEIGIE